MKKVKFLASIIALSLLSFIANAQTEGVSIKTTAGPPHSSAMLDIESASKGLLIPRVALSSLTSSTTPIASPTTGLLVYNLTSTVTGGQGFYYWTGSEWMRIANGNGGDLWTARTLTATGGGTITDIYRPDESVSVGTSTTNSGSKSNLRVNAPAVFMAASAVGAGTASVNDPGIHLGNPVDGLGGHWNEINTPSYYLDMQFNTGQDIHMGFLGGTDLSVYSGSLHSPGNGGNIYAAGNITCTTLYQTSDSTLKKSINPYNNVLSRVLSCNVYDYRYKTETDDARKHVGILAQEIESQFPHLVRQTTLQIPSGPKFTGSPAFQNKTYKTVDYAGLTAILLQALKEQNVVIENLRTRVAALEH